MEEVAVVVLDLRTLSGSLHPAARPCFTSEFHPSEKASYVPAISEKDVL